jgi:DNA repair photolyase
MKIGITEAGDAGLDFSWVDKLYEGNIIITKQLTSKNTKLIELLLKNKEKIILHITCTGHGGTKMEPNVPPYKDVYFGAKELINRGFPINHIVLRVDPIIPTERGIQRAVNVLTDFKDTGIKRVRYSIIDLYPHVKKRIYKEYKTLPFTGFSAPKLMIDNLLTTLEPFRDFYEFEACAEELPDKTGCISQKDFDILGINEKAEVSGFQRKQCLCCVGKTELLTGRKRCPSGCLYCYWKD